MNANTVHPDYTERSRVVKRALKKRFPDALNIRTEPGYQGRVHVRVVSPKFDGLTEKQKQELLWDIFREELHEDSQFISIALAYGTDESYNPKEI
jgi:stress-induced morphogen